MPQRVVVFIDYQNVYRRAREAFGLTASPHMAGQVYPRRVGLVLRDMGVGERELVSVRVYRGMPSSKHDPKGYAAADRQVALWRQQALVEPITRPLNYRDPDNPQEKGIDVSIAVDFVRMGVEKRFDVGILFSGDTDLLPALEAMCELRGPQACEVAGWVPLRGSPGILRVARQQLRMHYLDQPKYALLADPTDYNQRRRRR